MALNEMIAQGAQFKMPDPLEQYGRIAQIQQAQNQNALAQYQINSAKRADETNTNFLSSLRAAGDDPVAQRRALMMAGRVEDVSKLDASALTQQKTQNEIRKQQLEIVDRMKLDLGKNPSKENITAYMQDIDADPTFSSAAKAIAKRGLNEMLGMTVDQRKQSLLTSGMSGAEMATAAKPQVVSPGASLMAPGSTTPLYTQPAATSNIAEFERAKTDPAFMKFLQERAAAMRPPAAPRAEPAPTITQIVDPTNPNQMIAIDAKRYQGGGAGSPGVIGVSGKEPGAALRTNKAEAGKTQLADDLENLRASFLVLDKIRAIPSTERNPLSNLASFTAASGVGQIAGRAFSTEAQVEREVINSARTRLVNSIKNATGMSAQQLNSNVELQTMLKSISDPAQPVQAALRIIEDIENAYVKGAGMPKKNAPGGGAPAPAATAPNIDALLNKYK
jgi:hypothetical protein